MQSLAHHSNRVDVEGVRRLLCIQRKENSRCYNKMEMSYFQKIYKNMCNLVLLRKSTFFSFVSYDGYVVSFAFISSLRRLHFSKFYFRGNLSRFLINSKLYTSN